MFDTRTEERELFASGFQALAASYLESRFPEDSGQLAKQFVESSLRVWQFENAQFNDAGKLLARPSASHGNRLFFYLGLKPTNKAPAELEPWQTIDHLLVGSNFDLIYILATNPRLDEGQRIARTKDNLGDAIFWAVALAYFSKEASWSLLLSVASFFAWAQFIEHGEDKRKIFEAIEPMRRAHQAQLKQTRNFVRPPDKVKAQKLREATDTYRNKYPKRSRNAAAKQLATNVEIGLGATRIKEYFKDWFTQDQWPNSPAGRKRKRNGA